MKNILRYAGTGILIAVAFMLMVPVSMQYAKSVSAAGGNGQLHDILFENPECSLNGTERALFLSDKGTIVGYGGYIQNTWFPWSDGNAKIYVYLNDVLVGDPVLISNENQHQFVKGNLQSSVQYKRGDKLSVVMTSSSGQYCRGMSGQVTLSNANN